MAAPVDVRADNSAILLSSLAEGATLAGAADFLVDPQHSLTLTDARRSLAWTPLTADVRNLGITDTRFWLRFRVTNDTGDRREVVLTHDINHLTEFRTFAIAPGGAVRETRFDPMTAFDARETAYPGPAAAIVVPAGESRQIVVAFSNAFPIPMHINLRLWSERGFEHHVVVNTAYFVFWIACLLAAAAFWFHYGAFMRQARMVFYALYMASVAAMYVSFSGIGYQLLLPSSDWLQHLGFNWAMFSLSAMSLEFARRHLEVARFHPRHDLVMRGVVIVYLALMALAFPSRFPALEAPLTFFAVTATPLYIFCLSWVAWRRNGLGYARWMVIGWAGVTVSVMMSVYGSLVNIPFSEMSQMDFVRLTFASTVVESLLLSASLAQWLRGQEIRRIDAERAAGRDALTGMLNRRGFDAHVAALKADGAWPGNLWLALIDLDRFKRINDVHSHVAGDAVLVHFAGLLRHEFRAETALARFGGEEFIVLFSAASAEQAVAVAERIGRRFADTPTRFEDILIDHTLSAGLVRVADGPADDEATLIAKADKALYAAKRAGRNCVRVFEPGLAELAAGAVDLQPVTVRS